MAQSGHRSGRLMSAIGGKADMRERCRHVRF
jgi:hypothetical protein